jgi:hypothetical protein
MRTKRTAQLQLMMLMFVLTLGLSPMVRADDGNKSQTNQSTLTESQLAGRQRAIASRYQRFEKLLLQLAEYMRKSDPEKADLLIRAIGKSKEDRVSRQMERVISELEGKDFGDAIERQDELVSSLRDLLSLLQSEDRRNELQDEIKRLEAVVKDLRKVIGQEKVARATTERGDNDAEAKKQQNKVAENTDKLLDKIKKHDNQQATESQQGKPSDGKPSDGKSSDGGQSDSRNDGEQESGEDDGKKPGDPKDKSDSEDGTQREPKDGKSGKPKDGESGESTDGKSGEPKDGKSGKPQDGKSDDAKDDQSGDQQQGEQDQTPGREEIEAARDEMERAIQELRKKNKDGANEAQDKAIAELIKARERLEEILRQLREEERELMLAALEARFRKMLSMQVEVYNGTVKLVQVPREKWIETFFGRSSQLGQLENDISLEASKVLQLLKEEGSSVAFPIAVEDLQEDMYTVARRLEEFKADDLTATIEQDIIEALTEMVDALQKEMEKSDEEKKKQQQQQGQKGDPALVDMIGELKMLRTLQQRVNRRTRILGRMIDGEQALDGEVATELEKLSHRQARIQKTAYDLATKRNK